jgi:hypothetical protein
MNNFGEVVEGYAVRVFNEREVRASAGILFFFAIISFMNAWLVGDFELTRLFVVAFLIEFFVRIFINPRFAPSMIIARFFVRNQKPEYVSAAPKKWAWSLGLVLAITMFYLVVMHDIKGPINIFTCISCLTLLFFESAFGICLGCKIYSLFNRDNCPDGNCEIVSNEKIQNISLTQSSIAVVFLVLIVFAFNVGIPSLEASAKKEGDCVVPQFAIDMGHEEKWKLHNGCK